MKFKRGKSEDWAVSDIILEEGQPGVEYCEDGSINLKIGNGVDRFSRLPYVNYNDIIDPYAINMGNSDIDFERCINIGFDNSFNSYQAITLGESLTAYRNQLILGQNNKPYSHYYLSTGGTNPYFDSYLIVGNGQYNGDSSNLFRVGNNEIYGSSSFNSSGADYSELFEWEDGNPNKEDRVGLFVTLSGSKIRIANFNDSYILGVVSATPAIIGDSYFGDIWNKAFITDIYGRYKLDEDGNRITNPEYNENEEYIPREDRAEWEKIGLLGKLVVNDDGSCEVGSFCKPADNGIATKSDAPGYYVMERLDDSHIKIMFK